MTKILPRLVRTAIQLVIAYLAAWLTFWIVHVPVLVVIGAIFNFDYEPVAVKARHIANYPMWAVAHWPEVLLSRTSWYHVDAHYGFWERICAPVFAVLFFGFLAYLAIVTVWGLFRWFRGLIRGILGRK
jgi:hypothetical protein